MGGKHSSDKKAAVLPQVADTPYMSLYYPVSYIEFSEAHVMALLKVFSVYLPVVDCQLRVFLTIKSHIVQQNINKHYCNDWFKAKHVYNAKQHVLSKEHTMEYKQIDSGFCYDSEKNEYLSLLVCKHDLISDVELVIDNPMNLRLRDMIKRIDFTIELIAHFDGSRKFFFRGPDIETDIMTICAFFGKKVRYENGKTIIPLLLGALHSFISTSLGSFLVHFQIQLVDSFEREKDCLALYGNVYTFIDRTIEQFNSIIYNNNSSFYSHHVKDGSKDCKNLRVVSKYPVIAIYCWGFDKTLAKGLGLMLNGQYIYRETIENLERIKHDRGIYVEPVIMFLSSEKIGDYTDTYLDFGYIDNINVILDTPQNNFDIYINLLELQSWKCIHAIGGSL